MTDPERQERTRPSAATREEEARDAEETADAGAPPTEAEARAADGNAVPDPEAAEHYEEMVERGAAQRGEGRVP